MKNEGTETLILSLASLITFAAFGILLHGAGTGSTLWAGTGMALVAVGAALPIILLIAKKRAGK